VHPLPQVSYRIVVKLVVAGRAKDKVGQTIDLLLHAAETGRRASIAKETREVFRAVLRMKITDGRVDQLVFKAELQAMTADDFRKVHLRIAHKRILILRVAIQPSELGEAAAQTHGEQPTGKRRIGRFGWYRQARSRSAQCRWRLARSRGTNSEACLQNRSRIYRPCGARHGLLIEDVDISVGIAAGDSGYGRWIENAGIALAIARK